MSGVLVRGLIWPVVALLAGLALAACGSGDGEEATRTAAPGTVASATVLQPGETTPVATPAPTPRAGDIEIECRDGESTYIEAKGRFALCYPSSMTVMETDVTGEPVLTLDSGEGDSRVLATFGWEAQTREPDGDPCLPNVYLIKNERREDYEIAGRTVSACLQDLYRQDIQTELVYRTILMEVPASVGYVSVGGAYFEPGIEQAEAVLERIFESLVIPEA